MRLLVSLILLVLTVPLSAQSWTKTREKMLTKAGYSLDYVYEGPEGRFLFSYTVQGDDQKILTEVLEGSTRGSGTRIYFEPAKDRDNVFMKTKMITLRRSLQSSDIKDSSLYQSLLAQIVGELPKPEPSEVLDLGNGNLIYLFGDKTSVLCRLEVDKTGSPVSFRRLEKGKEVKKLVFSNLKWGHQSIDWE